MSISPNSQSNEARDGVQANINAHLSSNPHDHAPQSAVPAATAAAPQNTSPPVANMNSTIPQVGPNGIANVALEPVSGATQDGPKLALNGTADVIAVAPAPTPVAAGVIPAASLLPLPSAGSTSKPTGMSTATIAQGNAATYAKANESLVAQKPIVTAPQPQAVVPNPLATVTVPNPLSFLGIGSSTVSTNADQSRVTGSLPVSQQNDISKVVPVAASKAVPGAVPVVRQAQPHAVVNQIQAQIRPNVASNQSMVVGGAGSAMSIAVGNRPASVNGTQPNHTLNNVSKQPVQGGPQQQQQIGLVTQAQQQVQAQPVRPQAVQVAAAAGTAVRPTVGQRTATRRLVLSPEGRDALTKAVLSSLKHPNGIMDLNLLALAMKTTDLTKEAILKAAQMARDRESEKKKAAGAVQNRPQAVAVTSQNRPPAVANVPPSVAMRMPQPANIQRNVHHQQQQQQQQQQKHLQLQLLHNQQVIAMRGQVQMPVARVQQVARPMARTTPHVQQIPQVQRQAPVIQAQKPAVQKKVSSPHKSEILMKAQKATAAAFSREMTNWKRIQHGLFLTSVEGSTQQVQIRTCSLGALARTGDTKYVLKSEDSSKDLVGVSRTQILALQTEIRAAGAIDGILPRNDKVVQPINLRGLSSPNCTVSFPKQRRFANPKVPIMNVSEKHKRLKLQPRKESRVLERNLRKHRQVACETLVKKHKDLSRSIISHSSEFFKFHRSRKLEISKFAKSIRDHVATEKRKKEKGDVNVEKARINALKANDMEAYTALVQETRNDRLKFLLSKTDQYIDQISGLLKDQQDGDGTKESQEEAEIIGNEHLSQIAEPNTNYYETAHVRQEEVKQPSILVGGSLKEYQVSGLQWLVSLYNNKLNGILADVSYLY